MSLEAAGGRPAADVHRVSEARTEAPVADPAREVRAAPAAVEIRDLVHVYVGGRTGAHAVDHVSLEVEEGEFYTLLGPSGCGKTTTLRCIAGLERPTSGEIILGGVVVSGRRFVPPHRRDVGMVFQDYAVWPHMTVFENVAFPLRVAHVASSQVRERVSVILEMMGMAALASRRATQLSGGQQQRLAVARALVRQPRVLLLDEPLSNLDAQLREHMRTELLQIQRRLKITTIFVTHDQVEALSMADRIAVMSHGRVMQEGPPLDIYRSPANEFVASFIGKTTFFRGQVESVDVGPEAAYAVVTCDIGSLRCKTVSAVRRGDVAMVAVRPEFVQLHAGSASGAENVFPGRVELSAFVGESMDYRVTVGDHSVRVTGPTKGSFRRGESVSVELPPEDCILLRANDGAHPPPAAA